MPVGYIHKASELELASILMVENINKVQHFGLNCLDGNSIPICDSSGKFPNEVNPLLKPN